MKNAKTSVIHTDTNRLHPSDFTHLDLYETLKQSRQQSTYLPLSIIAETIRDALHEDEDIAVLVTHLSKYNHHSRL